MQNLGNGRDQIRTALLLAAGTGSRLQPLTDDSPKCLTEINGTTILERLVLGLQSWDFERLVVVVGHMDGCLRDYLDNLVCGLDGLTSGLTIEYVSSAKYRTTNNIYSLWAARHAIQEPFLLLECDLIFDDALLGEMLEPDRIAVSRILPWMNGTTVSLDHSQQVIRFHMGGDRHMSGARLPELGSQKTAAYKTVNMYSFSQPSWQRITQRLEEFISAGRVNGYYEAVFAEMVAKGTLSFEAVFFDDRRWYEIDTLDDLREAERLFPSSNGRLTSGAVGP